MEMDNYLSSPKEGGAMDSLVTQPPQHKINKYKDISYSKSHKSTRHWTEKDEGDRKRRSRHKRERKLVKNVELSGRQAGRYYKDQACMDDIRDRSISNKNSENRTHRCEDDILKDLTKLCSSKRLFEDSGDVDTYKTSKRAKESNKYKENEKWDSILQGENTLFVGDISNIDSEKDDTDKSRLSNSSPTQNISDNERVEQILQVKNLRTDKSKIKKRKHRWQMNSDLELISDHELQIHQDNNVVDSNTYNENEILKMESPEALQYVDNDNDYGENTVMDTHVPEENILHHSISYQFPDPQLLESDGNLDTPCFSSAELKDDHSEIGNNILPYYPAIQGCRSVNEFQILNRVNEGTYGVVYRARDKHCGDTVALKRLKMENEHEGFPITSLREINTLLKGQHPNIVTVREIVMGSNLDKIFIVMDFVEHDLKSLIDIMRHNKQSFTAAEVKCLLKQLLCAVAYLHDNWILHRDLKTSNLLLSQNGILKVGDFGLAREYGSPLKAYTPLVVTLWYRAPELLLGTKTYSTHIDVWSVGCIFGELVLMNPVFQGKSEIDQIFKIFKVLGTPNETLWPGFNKLPTVQRIKFTQYPVSNMRSRFNMLTVPGQTLLEGLLTYNPAQRITAQDALDHSYFKESPLPIDPSMFPPWPVRSNSGSQRIAANTVPSAIAEGSKQLGHKDESTTGFRINPSVMENRKLPTGGGFQLKF